MGFQICFHLGFIFRSVGRVSLTNVGQLAVSVKVGQIFVAKLLVFLVLLDVLSPWGGTPPTRGPILTISTCDNVGLFIHFIHYFIHN